MEDLYWKVDFNKKTCFLVGKYSKYSFLHKQHISFDITDDDCFSEVENVLYTTWNIKLLKDFRFFVPELIANDILNRFPYTKGCSHSGLYGIEKIVIDENDYIIKKMMMFSLKIMPGMVVGVLIDLWH